MKRVLLIGGVIYLLILAGLVTLNGGLLVLALPLLLYLSAGLLFAPRELNLHIERDVDPERAASNTPITIRLSITNQGAHLEEVSVGAPHQSNWRALIMRQRWLVGIGSDAETCTGFHADVRGVIPNQVERLMCGQRPS